MKDNETKEKFIILRAEGLSFDKISRRIKVSKPTLIEWQKDNQNKINELKEIRFNEILEKYKATKEKRIERIAKQLQQVWNAYEKLEYTDLSKRELLMMIMRLERRLKEEVGEFEKFDEEMEGKEKEYKIIVERREIGKEDRDKFK